MRTHAQKHARAPASVHSYMHAILGLSRTKRYSQVTAKFFSYPSILTSQPNTDLSLRLHSFVQTVDKNRHYKVSNQIILNFYLKGGGKEKG